MLDTATAFFLAGERCAPPLAFGESKFDPDWQWAWYARETSATAGTTP